eukprot:m.404054 g.404054  ORF g.404054 m.404054 type:complete len:467 (+) comp56472_c0_seq1:38-1438(+)
MDEEWWFEGVRDGRDACWLALALRLKATTHSTRYRGDARRTWVQFVDSVTSGAQYHVVDLNAKLTTTPIDADHIATVVKALKNCPRLIFLDLQDNPLGPDGIHLLAPALKSFESLQQLSLARTKMSFAGIKHLTDALGSLHELQYLNLEDNAIEGEGGHHVAEYLKQHPAKSLMHLNIKNNELGVPGARYLVPGLHRMGQLLHLNLAGNHFGPEGFFILANGLRSLKQLLYLDVSNNNLQSSSLEALRDTLRTLVKLQHVDVSGNNFGPEKGDFLADGIRALPNLHVLLCQGNDLGPDSAKLVVAALPAATIRHVDLSANKLGFERSHEVIEMFAAMPALRTLNLTGNYLTDLVVHPLVTIMEKCEQLQELHVFNNDIDTTHRPYLARAATKRAGALDIRVFCAESSEFDELQSFGHTLPAEGPLQLSRSQARLVPNAAYRGEAVMAPVIPIEIDFEEVLRASELY